MADSFKIQGLKKHWPEFTLEADFEVKAGERAVIVGRSGSGKTSLFRLIAGLEVLDPNQDSGSVSLGARDITWLKPETREIGVVFQDQALFPALDLVDNATFGLMMRGMAGA